jgi:8-oxo-dGTP pyrophosphatase MutT (NUDIX family)
MLSTTVRVTVDQVRQALRRPLPGLAAQMRMAPSPRPGTERVLDPDVHCRQAGVLILLYPCADGLCLVLTRRTESVANHQGQISLPGGSIERDETPMAAALREAREELAVESAGLDVLGWLSRLYIPYSGFCIHPFVAHSSRQPVFVPEAAEVAEVIEEPLAHLLDPATRVEEMWNLRGEMVRVPFYALGEHKVWGATAMVLSEFTVLLRAELETTGDA